MRAGCPLTLSLTVGREPRLYRGSDDASWPRAVFPTLACATGALELGALLPGDPINIRVIAAAAAIAMAARDNHCVPRALNMSMGRFLLFPPCAAPA